ncbi:hypothetical protein BDZ90DRAFT_103814 [Jaminaea rosea]|uniref:Transmembrane protein 135 N-terminal domain-containing protein n=1 Tax=Jaminaea rosea TaxID=1569628 RepID=A0A316UWU8_9BASI|nr:hypothetical protein BDZ90DRAFT_103814 [Jaminaea rosea]PWN29268.1 hypothetical protein BDZ90DRAFT_103814 [Jaminaea rosea]
MLTHATLALSRPRCSPTIALRRTLESTTKSLRLFLSIFTYSTLYRSALHALLLLRSRILADSTSYAPRTVHREEGSSSSNRATLTHRTRIYARLLRVLRSSATLPLLSALLASPALLALLPPDAIPSASLGLWLISQSSSTAYTRARERGSRLVSWVPSWANSSLLYALGNGQLLWAFLFESTTFPQGYRNVILARSGTYIQPRPSHLPAGVDWPSKATISDHVALLATPSGTAKPFPSFTSPLLSSLGEKASRHPTTPYGAINPILDYSPAHPAHTRLMCAMLHPREPSCRTTLWNHFRAEWPASARFAGLFALLSSLLFRAKSWKRDPERQLFKLFSATLQGASVISGSIGTSWALICFFQHYLPATFLPRSRFFLNGFLSSLIWIKVVPRERRRELGLYTGRMSVQSTWDILERRGMVKGVKRGDVLVLAVGLGMLAALYEGGQGERGGAGAIAKRLFGERIQGVGEEGEERRGE